MYRKVDISKRLPKIGQFVTTIDEAGNHRVYRRTEHGWNMRDQNGILSPVNNRPLAFWLEEVEGNSTEILGDFHNVFNGLGNRNELDFDSFYEGWLVGRMNLAHSQ